MFLIHSLSRFARKEDGVTSVEYCVMLALILVVMMIGAAATGGGVAGWWTDIDSELDTHGF
jgi:Flp pilus assembly pilin Flp